MDAKHDDQGQAALTGTRTYAGGCHCGAVRFEVEADLSEGASRCNCGICTKLSLTARIVKPGAFSLLSDRQSLATYGRDPKTAQRFFCNTCGVHCFGQGHLPEVGGDYVSVNLNCLDDLDPNELKVIYWDGRHNNWDAGPRDTPWPVVAMPPTSA